VVAFRRHDESNMPSAKCFGYVQTYDEKPRRRLWELLKSQGMQENQQVVFMSDGGENVRRVQEYLHPFSEHLIDWFHITMRLTVLQQQTKALQEERPETGADVSKRLKSVKHLLWHGNGEEALERLAALLMELSLIQARSPAAKKVADGVTEFETYIRNNREFIPNFGERRRQGETISTAFVESTINQVVSRRFVKKQQMAWTLRHPSPVTSWTMCFVAGTPSSGFSHKRRKQGCLTPDLLTLSQATHTVACASDIA
jgi:hypothetical protein